MEAVQYVKMTEAHLEEVTSIYNYYVLNTTVSFHTEALGVEEMRDSVLSADPRFESYVISRAGQTAGYVLITQHKKKQAYQISGEVTIYLKPDCAGQGIGDQALDFIEGVARTNGFHSLVATVCLDNERSRNIFVRHGYSQCAHYREIGRKFGRLLDIVTYQKLLL
ncbi:MAG: acetyltransferase [Paenibacillaceae bacterium]|jgi:phosphinothricin acetyltransferase|nr:acetyltransferase [Paenibacillaceae bacterium]